ncbi:hydroxyacid dehydrogenase [Cerasicoccus fimbriatus]|uniref:hydroxyacid dehydrogenase n=1 Tax=Cerasicoccus fimbriatus TaxID=3014554 RepID=UPI0022B36689|nr:hydroxyacid dehydrogenase [Cerasicoccus sp. TK19100]
MPQESESQTTLLNPIDSANTRRILCALTDDELALFFPKGLRVAGAEIRRFDLESNTEDFRGSILEFEPEVIVSCWNTPLLEEDWRADFPFLRYVCHASGSVRSLLPRSYIEHGLVVTNWGTLVAANVAEHALLLILSGLRRSSEWPSVISGEREWQPSPIVTRTLFGKRVGLHGMGNVAQNLIRLLQPFDVCVFAYSEGAPEKLYGEHGAQRCDSLEALFAQSDILVECEALNEQTQGVVTRAVLEQLPEGALFVNVGRGAVVDEKALASLASEGRLDVALDVYQEDPIEPDSPLHQVADAVLSPHIAGPTSDQFARCGEQALRNLTAYLKGEPLEAVVTLEIYDRAT